MNYITYSPDTAALLAEVEANAPQYIITGEDGTQSIGPLTKTPTIRNGDETLAVVKGLPNELLTLTNLVVIGTQWWDEEGDPQMTLGEYPDPSGDPDAPPITVPDAQAIYDRVYPRTPTSSTGLDGEVVNYTPPELFGSIR